MDGKKRRKRNLGNRTMFQVAKQCGFVPKVRRPFQLFLLDWKARRGCSLTFESQSLAMKLAATEWRAMPSADKETYKLKYTKELETQHEAVRAQGHYQFGRRLNPASKELPPASQNSVNQFPSLQLGPFVQDVSSTTCLGQGAFGFVQVMVHSKNLRKFAVKVIRDSSLFESLTTEVELLEGLRHEAFLSPVASCLDGPVMWAAFPLVPEGSLGSYLRRHGPLRGLDFQAVATQLVDAVQYLNNTGEILHCDIKPSNCLFRTSVRQVFLVDFGISRRLPCAAGPGDVYTPSYRAPELWVHPDGARSVQLGSRHDAFATGCTLFEVAVGKKLCQGDDKAKLAHHMQQLLQQGRRPSADWKQLPPLWGKIIWQLAEPDSTKRCWPYLQQ